MKSLNPLEMELRSWTPRRPSPGLEARIFGAATTAPVTPPAPARETWWAPLLAPAMACFLLVMGFAKTGGPALSHWDRTTNSTSLAAAFTNATLPASADNRFTVEQNTVPARSFERILAFRMPTNAEDRHLLVTNTSGR